MESLYTPVAEDATCIRCDSHGVHPESDGCFCATCFDTLSEAEKLHLRMKACAEDGVLYASLGERLELEQEKCCHLPHRLFSALHLGWVSCNDCGKVWDNLRAL